MQGVYGGGLPAFFVHFSMGYYIRVLGIQDPDIHLEELSAALSKAGIACGKPSAAGGLVAELELDPEEAAEKWTIIGVANGNGEMLAQIERNPVSAGEFGQEELDEFRELIQGEEPLSAVQWLGGYFDQVKVIYAFQILNAALKDDNYDIITSLKSAIWDKTGGLLQADGEGFSNDQGYHILWQFPDTASGDRYCAVLDDKGEWQRFRMDLGDHFQRMAFRAGEVPQMAVRL
jgi:hypothetical protein